MNVQVPKNISAITPYPPGKPIEELEREYGISGSIKLASNENPFGPSPAAVEAIRATLAGLHRYPDGSGYYLTQALADHLSIAPGRIVLGNGSNEIIEFLVKAFVCEGDEVITSHPSFLMYQKFVQVRGGVNHVVELRDMIHDLESITRLVSERTRLIFLDNPNNPTATFLPYGRLESFLNGLADHVIVVLDEAYIDFVDESVRYDTMALIDDVAGRCGVVLLRTFSKAYGLAGLRIGYGLMEEQIAVCLHKVRQPFNVNLIAQEAARAALKDSDFYAKTLRLTAEGKEYLSREVEKLGCISYPSQTNFFLIDVKGDATALYEAMLKKGVIIRSMKAYGFDTFIRVNIGTSEENGRFVRALGEALQECGYV
ncbi:MAG: histidinol-phosphate transaminase [Desulfofustis sp.]|jgi:histidinol-phosphate aminotransferase|nr:histidinol-phosphate transaminase [Desulfofustis sp.]